MREATQDDAQLAESLYPAITGSQYRRAYCPSCRQPTRITMERAVQVVAGQKGVPCCSDCDGESPPAPGTNLTKRQREGLRHTGG